MQLAVSWNAAGTECESRPAVIQWRITPDPNEPLDNNQKFMKNDANSLVGNGIKVIRNSSLLTEFLCRCIRLISAGRVQSFNLNAGSRYITSAFWLLE